MAIQHNNRFTHTPFYIFADDDAWNLERITVEQEQIAEQQRRSKLKPEELAKLEPLPVLAWTSWDEHPISRFRTGVSRFDKATVDEYLLVDRRPTLVQLRRMGHSLWEGLQALFEAERTIREPLLDDAGDPVLGPDGSPLMAITGTIGRTRTLMHALRHGVDGCHDLDIKAPARGLTDTQIDQLRELLGDERFISLAYAALEIQRALTPDEAFT